MNEGVLGGVRSVRFVDNLRTSAIISEWSGDMLHELTIRSYNNDMDISLHRYFREKDSEIIRRIR